MPRLPSSEALPKLVAAGAALLVIAWVGGEVAQRRQGIALMERYAAAHPENADIAHVIVGCQEHVVFSMKSCASQIVQQFGPSVLPRIAAMGSDGAFGVLTTR